MTQTEAQRIAIRCNKLSSMAHGLYNDLLTLANKFGSADKLALHEREVMHSLDAISGGLEVIAGLVQCLEGEMLKAEKLAATLNDARARKRHWQGAAYNTKVGRRER